MTFVNFPPKISVSQMTHTSLKWILNTTFKEMTNVNFFFNEGFPKFGDFASGQPLDDKVAVGIFLDCVKPEGSLVSVLNTYNVAQVSKWLKTMSLISHTSGALIFRVADDCHLGMKLSVLLNKFFNF